MDIDKINYFKEFGYVVIENVFSDEEIDNVRTQFHNELLNYGIDHDNIINLKIPPPVEVRKKSEVSNIFYSEWKLKAHLDDRVYNLSKSLMESTFMSGIESGYSHPLGRSTKILPYIDRVCYRLPDYIRPEGGLTLHLDRNPTYPYSGKKFRPIQSFIALTDHYGNRCGGLQVVPEFHKISDTFFKNTNEPEGGEFYHMSSPKYSKLFNQIKTINMPKGSIVFWDNRLPHQTCNLLESIDSREVIYFSYIPDVQINKIYFKKQYENIINKIAPPSYNKFDEKVNRNWDITKLDSDFRRLKPE